MRLLAYWGWWGSGESPLSFCSMLTLHRFITQRKNSELAPWLLIMRTLIPMRASPSSSNHLSEVWCDGIWLMVKYHHIRNEISNKFLGKVDMQSITTPVVTSGCTFLGNGVLVQGSPSNGPSRPYLTIFRSLLENLHSFLISLRIRCELYKISWKSLLKGNKWWVGYLFYRRLVLRNNGTNECIL